MRKMGGLKIKRVFEKFVDERYANYDKPENTLRSYLDLLNQIVLKVAVIHALEHASRLVLCEFLFRS